MDAAIEGGKDALLEYLLSRLIPPTINGGLLTATRLNKLDMVELYLKVGADNIREALIIAATKDYQDIVNKLLSVIQYFNEYSSILYEVAEVAINSNSIKTLSLVADEVTLRRDDLVAIAANNGYLAAVKLFYNKHMVNHVGQIAAREGIVNIIEYLLDDVNLNCQEVARQACINNRPEILRCLDEYGIDYDRYELLMEVSKLGLVSMIPTLAVDIEDHIIVKCVIIALKHDHMDVVKYFKDTIIPILKYNI